MTRFLNIINKCALVILICFGLFCVWLLSSGGSILSTTLSGIPCRWFPLTGQVQRVKLVDGLIGFSSFPDFPNEAYFVFKGGWIKRGKWHFGNWIPKKSISYLLIKNAVTTRHQRLILWNKATINSQERRDLEEGYTLNPKLSNDEFDWLIEQCQSWEALANLIERAETKEQLVALFDKIRQNGIQKGTTIVLRLFASNPLCPDEIKSVIRESENADAKRILMTTSLLGDK